METIVSYDNLLKHYEEMTSSVRCLCTAVTEIVGGQPADDKGLEQFVRYHLKLVDQVDVAHAIDRIRNTEVKDVTPDEGEVHEEKIYCVKALRHDIFGPYLGDWMIKACIKQAASRTGLFTRQRGSKGNFAEAGRVLAVGHSWRGSAADTGDWDAQQRLIHFYAGDEVDEVGEVEPNDANAPIPLPSKITSQLYWKEFRGRVNGPSGAVSILHHSECVPAGAKFSFEFRFVRGKLSQSEMEDVLAMMTNMGIGSARSLERGKFRIDEARIKLD